MATRIFQNGLISDLDFGFRISLTSGIRVCTPLMLTEHGIRDTDLTIHSHFLSYLAFLGQVFGYSGVVECPLPDIEGEFSSNLGEVRPDVLWFDKGVNFPIAAFEFERFEPRGEAKLREKIENLVIAYNPQTITGCSSYLLDPFWFTFKNDTRSCTFVPGWICSKWRPNNGRRLSAPHL